MPTLVERVDRLIKRFIQPAEPSKSGSSGKLDRLVEEYANVVGRFGPDSPQALKIRTENANNAEFLKFAQSIDRLKRAVGGSGMDTTACHATSSSSVTTR